MCNNVLSSNFRWILTYLPGIFMVITYQTSDREAMFVARNDEIFMIDVLDYYTVQKDKAMYSTV